MIPIMSFDLQALAVRAGLAVAIGAALWVGGCTHERHQWEVKQAASESLADAKSDGLKAELQLKDDTHEQLLDFIGAVYQRDLDSLRKRPPRRIEVIRGGTCEGVSGAELSRPDAEFLTGEAARAERIRTERDELADKFNKLLKACSE